MSLDRDELAARLFPQEWAKASAAHGERARRQRGVWRMHLLPDGRQVAASFDGSMLGRRRWQTKTFGYHNPPHPTGEMYGAGERFTQAYDTFVIADLPEGVTPTHFRPNDTVHGAPVIKGGDRG